jgi:hypothetical protein
MNPPPEGMFLTCHVTNVVLHYSLPRRRRIFFLSLDIWEEVYLYPRRRSWAYFRNSSPSLTKAELASFSLCWRMSDYARQIRSLGKK